MLRVRTVTALATNRADTGRIPCEIRHNAHQITPANVAQCATGRVALHCLAGLVVCRLGATWTLGDEITHETDMMNTQVITDMMNTQVVTQEPQAAAQDILPAVFPNRAQAEEAIEALRRMGLREDDIGIVIPQPGRYLPAGQADQKTLKEVASGAAVGVPLGALAGIALASIAFPGVGAIGAGGLLLGAPGGALWGAVLGGYGGLIVNVRTDAAGQVCEIPMNGDDVLVVARVGEQAERVNKARLILEHHGARCFLDQVQRTR